MEDINTATAESAKTARLIHKNNRAFLLFITASYLLIVKCQFIVLSLYQKKCKSKPFNEKSLTNMIIDNAPSS